METLVTGVIPLHDHQHWVHEAIDSIASQDHPHKRIVVVDDHSRDGSVQAVLSGLVGQTYHVGPQGLEQYQGLWKGVPLMLACLPRSHGPAFARNLGMKIGAEGTALYALLDSDDTYQPGKVSRSVAVWQRNPDQIGVVYSDYETVTATGKVTRQFKEPYSRKRLLEECIVNCDSLVSRQAFEKVGGFAEDMRVCEDYLFWLQVSRNFVLYHLAEPLVRIRVGTHSSTSTVPRETWEACYQKMRQRI